MTGIHAMLADWVAGPGDINAVVVLDIEAATPLTSPAYDRGTTEEELRRGWFNRYAEMQPRGIIDG